jgi:hypothetical protein
LAAICIVQVKLIYANRPYEKTPMKTTAEVKQGSDGKLQFLAARLDNWDITKLVDTSKIVGVKTLEQKVKSGKPAVVDVEISDKVVEDVINRLWGYAKYNYVQAVYGIPESFRFP